ncbi:MAG: dihydrodipicolinate synthase family protein [Halanaeroarchaeum sp.]
MKGVGPPLVTPFTESGDIDETALRGLVGWVERRDVDFLVPCGSTSEAELMTAEERARVVDIVTEEASIPVVAGTGSPGLRETMAATREAAQAGATAALVVTPFYYEHDQETLLAYYRAVADAASIPVYLYSVPPFTDVRLEPETVEQLARHPNVAGIKDSSGDIGTFMSVVQRTASQDFDPIVGSASVFAPALDAGATGGIMALANLAPEALTDIAEIHPDDPQRARERNAALVDLNRAVTSQYGIPGLKWAMRERGAPAGYSRSPHRSVDDAAKRRIDSLLEAV